MTQLQPKLFKNKNGGQYIKDSYLIEYNINLIIFY